MALLRSRKSRRYCPLYVLGCIAVGFSFFALLSAVEDLRLALCSPKNPELDIIDRQDEWQYQNSITAQWYYWRTKYQKQHKDPQWPVHWLNRAPQSYLGVIVYLTSRNEIEALHISLAQLSRCLVNNPRPVVLFHEGDLNDTNIQQSLARTLGPATPLAFEWIKISNHSNRPRTVHLKYPRNYFDMCRFFTLMLPSHPLLTLFTFYWRLDSHSYIFGPKPIEDPFEIMQQRKIQYTYVMVNDEGEHFATGLWSLFHQFLAEHCLKPSRAFKKTQTGWYGGYALNIFYTNFAIANVSFFRDHPLMQAWLHTTDNKGGIYRYRWGDAPIHTLAVTQLIERDQIARLRYFGYLHRDEYVCASGTKDNLCREQARPLFHDSSMKYKPLRDGCSPYGNPLCHYYPEIEL